MTLLKLKVLIKGGGDLASAVAHRLERVGCKVLVAELAVPLSIRRTVSFSEAIFEGEVEIEGVKGKKIALSEIEKWDKSPGFEGVAVVCDEAFQSLELFKPDVLIDATLRKENIGMSKELAPITLALGPGFVGGVDVDGVIETNRGHYLGRIYYQSAAMEDTGLPGDIEGFAKERVIYAPCSGVFQQSKIIGDHVKKMDLLGEITLDSQKKQAVYAPITGVIRGLIPNGSVEKGQKIGDVDPRNDKKYIHAISDKGRNVSGGVLEAILYLKRTLQD